MKCIFPCVLFPDIGGGTQGETLDEALNMAEDLVNCVIEDGEEIPIPMSTGNKVGRKENPLQREVRTLRAFDDEWQLIRDFVKLLRARGVDDSKKILDAFK